MPTALRVLAALRSPRMTSLFAPQLLMSLLGDYFRHFSPVARLKRTELSGQGLVARNASYGPPQLLMSPLRVFFSKAPQLLMSSLVATRYFTGQNTAHPTKDAHLLFSPRFLFSLLLLFFFYPLFPIPYSLAFAQMETATLSGVIQDPKGGMVPDVEVTATRIETGTVVTTKTNGAGIYFLTGLMPGHYHLMVRKPGFKEIAIKEFQLHVQDKLEQNFSLEIGSVSETVTVTAGAPLLNTTDATVSTVVDRNFVGTIPLNGRSFQSLILLTPGVTAAIADDDRPGQFSVNGARTNANYFTIDGVSANIGVNASATGSTVTAQLSGAVPGLSAFGGTNNLISIDALEEYRIQTSSYSAEFGRQPGGQIQLVTRSGSNQFHGTLFDYVRNDFFDARPYFNRICSAGTCTRGVQPPLRQNQFGGTFSGPVILPGIFKAHNRTFFFFSYEGLRLRQPQSFVTFVPSQSLRQEAPAPVALLLNGFPTTSNNELIGNGGERLGVAPLTASISDPSTLNAWSIRLDHRVGSISLFGRYNDAPSTSLRHPHENLSRLEGTRQRTQTVTLGATFGPFATFGDELRFNYSKNRGSSVLEQTDTAGAVPVSKQVLTSGYIGHGLVTGVADFILDGIDPLSDLDVRQGGEAQALQRQLNVNDTASLTLGRGHLLRFGGDYRRMMPVFAPTELIVNSTFTSLSDIRNGIASFFALSAFDGARPIVENYSSFLQDTWKISKRLTANIGVRWDINPAPTEANGKRFPSVIGLDNLSTAHLADPRQPYYRTQYGAFGPRLGIAYAARTRGNWITVLRAGGGLYYDLGNDQVISGFGGFPFSSTTFIENVSYPIASDLVVRPSFPPVQLPITNKLTSVDPNLTLPKTWHWNAGVEQGLGSNQVLRISYVASVGRDLLTRKAVNQGTPPQNPNFARIDFTTNGSTSDYHSLQIQFDRRLSNGLQALVNYTWSHAIDDVSDETLGFIGSGLRRGNADFDVRHNFSAVLTYDIPALRQRILRDVIGKWSIHQVLHLQSAYPVDINAGTIVLGDGTRVTERPDIVSGVPFYISDNTVAGGRRFNSAAFQLPPTGQQGNFGRNVLRGLPVYQADLSLDRQFPIRDRLQLKISFESFNIFNHPNFGGYGTFFQSPSTFGVPVNTLNRSIGGLNSVYQIGGPRSLQLSARLSF